MPSFPAPPSTTVELTTADGVVLTGDLAVPDEPIGSAIVCHPHPQYGGNRFDHVVETLFRALPARGLAALRFDFRREFGGGVAEIADARAALARVRGEVPEGVSFATGYSFGAMVALALDDDLAGRILVAPPLAAMEGRPPTAVPTLLLVPEHDQFSPPAATEPIVAGWTATDLVTLPMADHFLHGRTGAIESAVLAWLDERLQAWTA